MQNPTSVDLPESLERLFNFDPQLSAQSPAGGLDPNKRPGFAEGGLVDAEAGGGLPPVDSGVTPGGPGLAVPGGEAAPAQTENMEMEAKKLIKSQPAVAKDMLDGAMDAIEMGEITEEMILQGGKMALVVSRNPDMYPKMVERLKALGAPEIPPEYDPEFIFTAILLMLVFQQKDTLGSTAAPVAAGPDADQVQDFAEGGYVMPMDNAKEGGLAMGPGHGTSDSIPINVSRGEFIIPAHAVRDLGVDHFQKKYIDSYKSPKKA